MSLKSSRGKSQTHTFSPHTHAVSRVFQEDLMQRHGQFCTPTPTLDMVHLPPWVRHPSMD